MYDRQPKSNFCGLSVSEQAEARGYCRSGIWLQISVACLLNVTFVKASHPNSKPYPFVALLLGFVSDRRRRRLTPSTKLRLRKPLAVFSAQNDRLIDCLVVFIRNGGMSWAPSPTNANMKIQKPRLVWSRGFFCKLFIQSIFLRLEL